MTDTLQDNKFMFGSKEITCQYCKKTLPSKFCKRHSPRTSITHRVYSATPTPQPAAEQKNGDELRDVLWDSGAFDLLTHAQVVAIQKWHEQATERAEVAGRIDELGAVTTAAPHITSDWIDGRIKLLEARLRTLTTLDKEKRT